MKTWEWIALTALAAPGLAAVTLWWLLRSKKVAADEAGETLPATRLRRLARVVTVFVVGMLVLLFGVILAIPGVPGPGFVFILLGLAILATEFVWARWVLHKMHRTAARVGSRFGLTTAGPPVGASRLRHWAHRCTMFWVRLAERWGAGFHAQPKESEQAKWRG
jgi:uncharacterized protein (TIGR02611 family)